jgi:hypothetical protein
MSDLTLKTFHLFDVESREYAKSEIRRAIEDSQLHQTQIRITICEEGNKETKGQMILPFVPASGCLGKRDFR